MSFFPPDMTCRIASPLKKYENTKGLAVWKVLLARNEPVGRHGAAFTNAHGIDRHVDVDHDGDFGTVRPFHEKSRQFVVGHCRGSGSVGGSQHPV